MAQRIGGSRRKTRHSLKKGVREKGKISITRMLQSFDVGDKVLLKAEPAVQKGIYARRFHGKVGVVKAKRGSCYEVVVKEGKKEKTAVVSPVHLHPVRAGSKGD